MTLFRSVFICALILIFQVKFSQAQTPPAADSYTQGLALFQQKQYAAALPLFEQAEKEKPNDAQVNYHLAYCQYLTGDLKDAALHFYIVDRIKANPAMKAYADKIKFNLPFVDQQWVENQLQPKTVPVPENTITSVPSSETRNSLVLPAVEYNFKPFGFRLGTGLVLANMDDFNTEKDALATIAQNYQTTDSTLTYDQSIPFVLGYFEINPFCGLGDFEIGGRFSYFFPTSATYYRANTYGYSVNFSDDFDTFSLALTSRFYLKVDEKSRFFIEPILGFQPLHMTTNFNYKGTSSTPPNGVYGFNMDGSTLNTGLNIGFKFKTSEHFNISVGAGYEYARFENLHGTYFDSKFTNLNNIPGKAVMAYSAYWGKYLIWFLPDDPAKNLSFYNSNADAQNTRPLVVDFGGVRLSLDCAFVF